MLLTFKLRASVTWICFIWPLCLCYFYLKFWIQNLLFHIFFGIIILRLIFSCLRMSISTLISNMSLLSFHGTSTAYSSLFQHSESGHTHIIWATAIPISVVVICKQLNRNWTLFLVDYRQFSYFGRWFLLTDQWKVKIYDRRLTYFDFRQTEKQC